MANDAQSLYKELMAKMGNGINVLFDLSKMMQIDSSGLGVFIKVLQRGRECGGKVVLASIQPGPKIMFDITKVSRVFEIVPTVQDAKF